MGKRGPKVDLSHEGGMTKALPGRDMPGPTDKDARISELEGILREREEWDGLIVERQEIIEKMEKDLKDCEALATARISELEAYNFNLQAEASERIAELEGLLAADTDRQRRQESRILILGARVRDLTERLRELGEDLS